MKRWYLFILIFIGIICAATLLIKIFAVTGMFALFMNEPPEPEIKYGEFPISVIYEINGEIKKLEDTVVCEFDGFENRDSAGNYRKWKARLKSESKEFGFFSVGQDDLVIETGIFLGDPNYYMGDFEQSKEEYEITMNDDRFREYVEWKNGIKTGNSFSKDEVWEKYKFKIIDIKYSTPIQNTFK